MKTLDKFDINSKERENELRRENAYLFEFFGSTLMCNMCMPKEIEKDWWKLTEKIEKYVGMEEFTIGYDREE